MAGRQVPLVMVPRFTTYGGVEAFTTIPMDVTDYKAATLNVFRGQMPTDSSIAMTAQESTDQAVWSTCGGSNVSAYDPGAEAEGRMSANLKKRWFRLKIELAVSGGLPPYPLATCWAIGFLEEHE